MNYAISFRNFKAKDVKPTRGWRNNNPLNIRYDSKNRWRGKVLARNRKDELFEEFDDVYYGFRAACLLLLKYYYVYELNTPMKIVSRWAPPNENDSKLYALTALKQVHFRSANSPIRSDFITKMGINDTLPDPYYLSNVWIWFIEGMTLVESGKMPGDIIDNATMRNVLSQAFFDVLKSDTVNKWWKKHGK